MTGKVCIMGNEKGSAETDGLGSVSTAQVACVFVARVDCNSTPKF